MSIILGFSFAATTVFHCGCIWFADTVVTQVFNFVSCHVVTGRRLREYFVASRNSLDYRTLYLQSFQADWALKKMMWPEMNAQDPESGMDQNQ